MIFFIFTLLFMLSLSCILYLLARALPRLSEEPAGESDSSVSYRNILDRWAHSELPEKIDVWLNGFLLKFLRKFKVFVLKLDNTISTHLRKIHHAENGNDKKIDFKEIVEHNENR